MFCQEGPVYVRVFEKNFYGAIFVLAVFALWICAQPRGDLSSFVAASASANVSETGKVGKELDGTTVKPYNGIPRRNIL
jgi:hypothetical protein